MKNITTIEKTAMQKTAIEKNSKNNNNCLAVFFGIIYFDDELKSPSSAGQQANLVCGGSLCNGSK